MARGGYRPSAGRPKGSVSVSPKVKAVEAELVLSNPEYRSALDFAMRVINDPTAEMADKIRLAIAAMPFQHARLSDAPIGKKEQAQADADTAGVGTVWGDDLDTGAAVN